jgi:hypothetical protein
MAANKRKVTRIPQSTRDKRVKVMKGILRSIKKRTN